ncbi:Uu.00g106910.m01.CDS01 [Anthostomella pinea]|uniref:Uu.00g106910.m01.CDS01 n=1 Tax=Anthostomella pinea TaxID=933095 RepID=A0AAI8YFX6_9PEZI|nr:Uu.00g106910.m01.CDS01 [Anthostomella pinea]
MSLATAAAIKSSQPSTGESTPTTTEPNEMEAGTDSGKGDTKPKKRSLFGFGKKKTDEKAAAKTPSKTKSGLPSPPNTQDITQTSAKRSATTSPVPVGSPNMIPSSPRGLYSSSPRINSPAGSQIFERNVQESAVMPNSPAIPSHIQTEDHIPSVLDASSEAITNGHLNPDTVEIVTHNSHQPASVTVTGASPYESVPGSEDLGAYSDRDEAASNYGSLDSADVRRLSFISFADVVQAEHGPGIATGSRDSMHLAGLTSLASMSANRSPSPIRSPVSSQGLESSPPRSKSGSIKGLNGLNMSPVRRPLGSPASTEHNLTSSGELNIETMSQALRRTASTDFSAARSLPVSPIEGPSR